MEEGEEKERNKKNFAVEKECFPGPRPTLLTVQLVAAVRCNLRLI
jgi:hypothetical protein